MRPRRAPGLPAVLGGLVGGPLVLLALLALVVGGCSPDTPAEDDRPSGAASPTEDSPADGTVVAPPAEPERGACYRLDLDEALAASSGVAPRDCSATHTSRTYLVGRLDRPSGGRPVAVDSARVREQVAQECPDALPGFVGGGEDGTRLSVLRAIWFTPSQTEAEAGARWFRCDVVALDGQGGLVPLGGRLAGTLATPAGRDRWGLCATGAPDDPAAQRVPCARPHSWRAVSVVGLGGPGAGAEDYPGEAAARRRGQEPCEQAGRERAADPLDFRWGYEWPTAEQWAAGQRFGRCWVPDSRGAG